jgi:NADPH:quinone reductase-like Zn-dependent oxidoreductase
VAERVEAVGTNVTVLQPGDEVFGSPFMRGFGVFAEYASVSDDLLAPKPANLSFEQAAAVPMAALTALQGLRDHGPIERPVIDRAYSLSEVPEAIGYLEEGHARGKVVITV